MISGNKRTACSRDSSKTVLPTSRSKMQVYRKCPASGGFTQTDAEESSDISNRSEPLSKKIRRCDSSADAASLLLLLSKQAAGESTSQAASAEQESCPGQLGVENYPVLLPPPRFGAIRITREGKPELRENPKLKPLDSCILNYNDYTSFPRINHGSSKAMIGV